MTFDVSVRRCTLTIRRRDGWSWGSAPQPHLQAALSGVEMAIESAVAESGLALEADVTIQEPVRLEVGSDGVVSMASRTALVERLRALPSAQHDPLALAPASPGSRPAPSGGPVEPAGPTITAADAAAALARTLARWSRGGQAGRIVTAWPAPLVRSWIAALSAAVQPAGPGGGALPGTAAGRLTAEAVARIAAAVLAETAGRGSSREAADRMLILLAALTATLGDRLPDAATQALAWERVVAAGPAPPEAPAPASTGTELGAVAHAHAEVRRRRSRRVELVVPALPLLVLGQLSRIGYVDAMVGAAAVAGLPQGAGALGSAVAGKVLPPPDERGVRAPAEVATVAIASGRPADDVAPALAAVAAHERALVVPLASALQAAYAEGRSASDELLVWTGEPGTLLGEETGLLPVAWVAGEDELEAALVALGRPPLRCGEELEPLARALAQRPGVPGAPALDRHLGAGGGHGPRTDRAGPVGRPRPGDDAVAGA